MAHTARHRPTNAIGAPIARSGTGRRRLVATLVAVACVPVAMASAPQVPAQAQTTTKPAIFQGDADGLVVNRRPANVGLVGVSNGVLRIEDSRELTAAADGGFAALPDTNTMQQVVSPVTWPTPPPGEVIDSAVGFLSDFTSPDLVVLRGASGRWTDRPTPAPDTSLVWYGQQRNGYRTPTTIPLAATGSEIPVGVEIVNNLGGARYILLATRTALYAFRVTGTPAAGLQVAAPIRKDYPGSQILGIHHQPLSAASAAEEFTLPTAWPGATNAPSQHDVVAVAVAPSTGTSRTLTVDFVTVSFTGFTYGTVPVPAGFSSLSTAGELVASSTLTLPVGTFTGVPTGADVRFSIAQSTSTILVQQFPAGQELRVDVNLTTAAGTAPGSARSTEQWAGRASMTGQAAPNAGLTVQLAKLAPSTVSSCASPATGFDALYFRAATRVSGGEGRVLQATVMCASPVTNANGSAAVVLGGYDTRYTAGSYGIRPLPTSRVDVGSGAAAVQPQVFLAHPCVQQLRFVLRQQNPSQADLAPANLLSTLQSDATFMKTQPNWLSTYRCSAAVNTGAETLRVDNATHLFGGNVQATVGLPLAPAGTAPLGGRSAATRLRVVTRALEIPDPVFDLTAGTLIRIPKAAWRTAPDGTTPAGADTLLDPPDAGGTTRGAFLTRFPTTDIVERVRLTGAVAGCVRKAPTAAQVAAGQKGTIMPGTCVPTSAVDAPTPIAVMAAPPYVQGSGQAASTNNPPEFANGTSATQATTEFTSSSVGAEIELTQGYSAGEDMVVSTEVTASLAVRYERTTEATTGQSLTVSKSIGYGGSRDTDTIVTNNVRNLVYTGVVVDSSLGMGVNNETTVRLPIGNVVTSQTLRDLRNGPTDTAKFWAPDSAFGKGLQDILRHVPGMPGTYDLDPTTSDPLTDADEDADLSAYCIGDLDPTQGLPEVRKGSPAPANPFVGAQRSLPDVPQILTGGWGEALAGNDAITQRSDIGFGSEFSSSFLESNEISASASVEVRTSGGGAFGGIKGTVSAGGSWGNSYESSLGTDTTFSGSVGSIPDARLTDEQFGWRMFVCKKEITRGFPVWVQGYQVRDYGGVYQARGAKAPEDLGPVAVTGPRWSQKVTTRPTMSWMQPTGTVKDYTVELEAIGAEDHRELTASAINGSGVAVSGWPAVSTRADATTFNLPPSEPSLIGNQLYRWRVISNNFFYNSTQSDWEYFVTSPAPPTVTSSTAPAKISGAPFVFTFSAPVTGIDPTGQTNVNVKQVGFTKPIAASVVCKDLATVVDCATGAVSRVELTPTKPLVAGEYYFLNVAETGTPITGTTASTSGPVATYQGYGRAQTSFLFDEQPIKYSWRTVNDAAALGGSYVVEAAPGATASTTIVLTKAAQPQWWLRAGPANGRVKVDINRGSTQVATATLDTFDFTLGSRLFNGPATLQAGTYRVTFTALGTANQFSQGTLVGIDAIVVDPGVLDNPADDVVTPTPSFTYQWGRGQITSASDTYALTSATPATGAGGTSAQMSFRGTGVVLSLVTSPVSGRVRVTIDGGSPTTVNLYATSRAVKDFTFDGLVDTNHTVKIETIGTKNNLSTGFDAGLKMIKVL